MVSTSQSSLTSREREDAICQLKCQNAAKQEGGNEFLGKLYRCYLLGPFHAVSGFTIFIPKF